MARLSFRCPAELVAEVDKIRGGTPRERWLREIVMEAVQADEITEVFKGTTVTVEESIDYVDPLKMEPVEDPAPEEPPAPMSYASRSEMFKKATQK